MRNIHGGFVSRYCIEIRVNFIFGDRIERSRGLIQEDERRIFAESAGQRDFLRLSAGNLYAGLIVILIQICMNTAIFPFSRRMILSQKAVEASLCEINSAVLFFAISLNSV